jgi:ParB family chromosome partitioning protein
MKNLKKFIVSKSTESIEQFPIEFIHPNPNQPRRWSKERYGKYLKGLAESIRQNGVVEPLVVRSLPIRSKVGAPHYEIIAGEMRWRGCQLVGLDQVPCIVRQYTDLQARWVALIENIQRESLTPMDIARAIGEIRESFRLSFREIGKQLGIDRTAVAHYLSLLDLDITIQEMIHAGCLSMGHGKVLRSVENPKQRLQLAQKVVDKRYSVRQLEQLCKELRKDRPLKPTRLDPNIEQLSREMSERIGSPVYFKHQKKGGGKVEIIYASLEELDGILELLRFGVDQRRRQ